MKKVVGFVAGLVLCLPLVGIAAMVTDSAYTVGEFAVVLASSLDLAPPEEGFDSETALATLNAAGVALDQDPDAALTEAAVVDALNQLGLNVTTSSPDTAVSRSTANQVLASFGLKGPGSFVKAEKTKSKSKTKKPKASPKE